MKKVLSIALALFMVIAMVPVTAEAADNKVTFEIVPSAKEVLVGDTVEFTVSMDVSEAASKNFTNVQSDFEISDGLELPTYVDDFTGVTMFDIEDVNNWGANCGFKMGEAGKPRFGAYGVRGTGNTVLFKITCKVTEAGTHTFAMINDGVLKAEINGRSLGTCVVGSATVTAVKAPCTTHAYDNGAVTTAATCTAAGVKTYTCTECGATKTEAIAALGHDMSDAVETKAPTCTEEGLKTATCSRCGHEVSEPIAALGHDMGAYTQTKAPTCTAAGEETATCSRCDHKDTKPVAALGHDFGAYTVTKAPTCTAEGEETATCSRCDVTTTRPVEKVAHVDEDKDCKCDVCGNVAHVGETEWQVISEATCEENGKEAEFCKTCGKATGKERAIKANGHVDANKDGICDVCNKEVEHKHVDADKDGICDDPNCGQKIEASKTGDNASIALYATLMLAAAAVVVLRKRVEA